MEILPFGISQKVERFLKDNDLWNGSPGAPGNRAGPRSEVAAARRSRCRKERNDRNVA